MDAHGEAIMVERRGGHRPSLPTSPFLSWTPCSGKKPQSVVARLGKRARVRLYQRLVHGGVLRAEDDRILGIFPTHRWPSDDVVHEPSVRSGLVTALREGATTDARTGALISLLLALRAVYKAVDPAIAVTVSVHYVATVSDLGSWPRATARLLADMEFLPGRHDPVRAWLSAPVLRWGRG